MRKFGPRIQEMIDVVSHCMQQTGNELRTELCQMPAAESF